MTSDFLFSMSIGSTLQDVIQSLSLLAAAQNIQVVFMQVFYTSVLSFRSKWLV